MVIVRWDTVSSEIVCINACFVDIRDVNIAHLVAVLKKYVHSVVVLDEFCQFISEGILGLLALIDPVT